MNARKSRSVLAPDALTAFKYTRRHAYAADGSVINTGDEISAVSKHTSQKSAYTDDT